MQLTVRTNVLNRASRIPDLVCMNFVPQYWTDRDNGQIEIKKRPAVLHHLISCLYFLQSILPMTSKTFWVRSSLGCDHVCP